LANEFQTAVCHLLGALKLAYQTHHLASQVGNVISLEHESGLAVMNKLRNTAAMVTDDDWTTTV
jgi:hypothetical protein